MTFWMLAETIELRVMGNRSFVQLYAEEHSSNITHYKLVLHKRVEGLNTFVRTGPTLHVDQTYYARFYLYNYTLKYQLSESPEFDTMVYEMNEHDIVPRDYRYLMFTTMFVNDNQQKIWSSGIISDVKTSETS